jgi:hypothetical protein
MLHAAAARQHTIDMTAGSSGPTCYGVARNEDRTGVLHSRVAPPIIILSCCYVSECCFEQDRIPPSASFTL